MRSDCSPSTSPPDLNAPSHSLYQLLRDTVIADPNADALLAPNRSATTRRRLLERMDHAHESLLSLGVGRGDRIATLLGDCSETALALMSVMAFAAAAPINPRNAPEEIARQLHNLRARAVLIPTDCPSPARAAVARSGVPVIELTPDGSGDAGGFRLAGSPLNRPDRPDPAPCAGRDEIIVVQTSGTTGNPKVIALKHNQLLSMMLANCRVLELTPDDRCLGVMPLFHIHGLGAVLTSLLSGGSVAVTEGFSADSFFQQLRDFNPTWYTAVPTIHQAILARAALASDGTPARIAGRVRLIRSGSAPMPRPIPERLEALFGAIYIEACGATECSAYIASNSPSRRKPASQGLPMPDTQVRVIDEHGNDLPPGRVGELIVRGPGVFDGYEANPELNEAAFFQGYFRTGDLVYRDEEGFIFIAGRIKEQINRGGMKISPLKVDDVIALHPAIRQCVTFAAPDPRLDQEVACAVVLHPGARVGEIELQRHAASHLADFEVPRRFLFVDSIPKGPTGKILRIGLAEKLGLRPPPDAPPPPNHPSDPGTPIEQQVASIWSGILGMHVSDINTTFMQLGGDSLQAMRMMLEVEKRFGIRIPIAALFSHGTVHLLSALIESEGWRAEPGAPVILRDGPAASSTLFCLPGIGGNVYCFQAIASGLADNHRVIGLPLPGADGLEPPLSDMARLADRFIAHIRRFQPRGPYALAGYSFGGRAAVEVANRLRQSNESVTLLALLDTPGPNWPRPGPLASRIRRKTRHILERLGRLIHPDEPGDSSGSLPEDPALAGAMPPAEAPPEHHRRHTELVAACKTASRRWRPRPLANKLTLLRTRTPVWTNCDVSDVTMGWGRYTRAGLEIVTVPGTHGTLFHAPFHESITREIRARLRT